MKILIATHNKSKFERYQRIMKIIPDLEIFSLSDLKIEHKASEDFLTNIENALHKAEIYAKISGLITVAVDEALKTNFLPDNKQPGVYARRLGKNKKELTDADVIEVWKKRFEIYPQEDKKFFWNFAVAFYNPQNGNKGVECVEEIAHVAKYFSELPTNGYPMSTFLSFEKNGIPYLEIGQSEKNKKDVENFASFVKTFTSWLELN